MKKGDPVAGPVDSVCGFEDLLDRRTLFHRIEDLLAARLRTDPDLFGTGCSQCFGGVLAHEQVRPAEALEWQRDVVLDDEFGEALDPPGLETEDVIGEPDVLDSVLIAKLDHLGHDILG